MELLTPSSMSALEAAAIRSGAVTGEALMERAGRGVVEAALSWRPVLEAGARRAVVLCGPGNNGGDGYVIARLLRERWWEVELFAWGDPETLPPDAAANARRWREGGGAIRPWGREALLREAREREPDLWIDALFGGGLSRAIPEEIAETFAALEAAHDVSTRLVAVDGPSGLNLGTGRDLGGALRAGLAVTFHRPRVGHHLADGPALCGAMAVADIGLEGLAPLPEDAVRLVGPPAPARLLKGRAAHKYGHGHALILSGGVGRGGAARLAARAALRVGAGLVTLGCPPSALIENAARLDAVMLRPVADAEALGELDLLPRLTALCLGPGMGVGARTRGLLAAARAAGLVVVADADALTSFEDDPEALFALLDETCILTPHPGEFRRLFPDLAADEADGASKVEAARQAAARAGAVVLLKGPDTVIAAPSGRCAVHSAAYGREAPGLATAGSGDVLAGLIAGLAARGFAAFDAACAAAWLHAEAARAFGPGLIAEDLPEMLPQVLRRLSGAV